MGTRHQGREYHRQLATTHRIATNPTREKRRIASPIVASTMDRQRTIYSQIGPYSAIVERPPLRWPGNARLALWIVPNVEYYQFLPAVKGYDPWPRTPHPDVMMYGLRDYGNRVGFWRMMEILDRHSVRATLSLNIACYENFPEIMEACERRNYDVMSHGMYNTVHVRSVRGGPAGIHRRVHAHLPPAYGARYHGLVLARRQRDHHDLGPGGRSRIDLHRGFPP